LMSILYMPLLPETKTINIICFFEDRSSLWTGQ
jgi:hypothetical protein